MKATKSFVTLCIIVLASTHIWAQPAQKVLNTKITDVTVFMRGAQIKESCAIQLKEGENLLRVVGLTAELDANSIQVEGNPEYTIMSVRHQFNYSTDAASNPRIKAVSDSLDEAKFKQQELAGLKNVVAQEKALLESNRKITGENSTLVVEDLQDMANFFRKRFQELEYKRIELEDKERKNNGEVIRLQNLLNSMNARKGSNPGEILLSVQSSKSINSSLVFSYVVRNAGWYPIYDLRASDVNSPIDFVYRAKVYQSTGRDWERVNLTISTGNPTIGGVIPNLYPWYLNIREQVLFAQGRANAEMKYNETPSVREDSMKDSGMSSSRVITSADYTTIENNTVNTEFKISVPYDIPSDNQQYDVIMQTQSLKAEYMHVTVPKLDNDAFLRAQVTDWAQYSLLPGESNIYFKGTFVGKGYIDPAQANDTLSLSLGRDRGINIKREMLKEYSKTGIFGSKQQTSRAYEITVQNNKKQAVSLEIEDQLPISKTGEIEVITDDISGAQYDTTTGKLTWKVNLAPGETVKKYVRFTVKYPKKKFVSGL